MPHARTAPCFKTRAALISCGPDLRLGEGVWALRPAPEPPSTSRPQGRAAPKAALLHLLNLQGTQEPLQSGPLPCAETHLFREAPSKAWLLSSGPSPQNQQHLQFCHGDSLRGRHSGIWAESTDPGPAASPQNPERPCPHHDFPIGGWEVRGNDLQGPTQLLPSRCSWLTSPCPPTSRGKRRRQTALRERPGAILHMETRVL